MKRAFTGLTIAVALLGLVCTYAQAADIEMSSFSGNGLLTWTNPPRAYWHTVQWCADLESNTWHSSWDRLDGIGGTGSSYTAEVPMFYRVMGSEVPSLTNGFATNGLVGYYAMDGNANDSSSYTNHGVATSVTYVEDRFGAASQAAAFDGTNSYITIPHATHLNLTNTNVTVVAWIKTDPGYEHGGIVVEKRDVVVLSYDYLQYRFRLTSTGSYRTGHASMSRHRIEGLGSHVSEDSMRSDRQVNDGEWHQLAMVRQGDHLLLYVDGDLQDVEVNANAVSGQNTADIDVGRSTGLVPTDYYRGYIDTLLYYNRALSQMEVRALLAAGQEP